MSKHVTNDTTSYVWPETFTDRSRRIMDRLVGIGPRDGYVSDNYKDAPAEYANPALSECEDVIGEMAENHGKPGRHCNPNPFYTRDGQQANAMGDLLHGKSRLVSINTDLFIELAAVLDVGNTAVQRVVDKLVPRFKQGLEVDAVYFTVEPDGSGAYKIINHEGRTRAYAARQAGVRSLKAYLHSHRKFADYAPVTLVSEESDEVRRSLPGTGALA